MIRLRYQKNNVIEKIRLFFPLFYVLVAATSDNSLSNDEIISSFFIFDRLFCNLSHSSRLVVSVYIFKDGSRMIGSLHVPTVLLM